MIIEDDSFAWAYPRLLKLRKHARLVESDYDQLRLELDQARKNIEKLVAIHRVQAAQISRLNSMK